MAGKKSKIEWELALKSGAFKKNLSLARKNLSYTAKQISRDFGPAVTVFKNLSSNIGLAAAAAGTAATVGGFFALQSVLRSSAVHAIELDRAMYNMGTSLDSANRQFDVGSIESWESTVKNLRTELKIFSETDLRNGAARTLDMTKRLGLSEEQMRKVIVASANLGAGKFALVDSIERTTAALRGEAEASEALGLTLNETYVKGWHEAHNTLGKAWKDLTDVEKAQIRLNILLEQAGPSAGRAAGSYKVMSGSVSAVAASYNELLTSIGGIITKNSFFVDGAHVVNDLLQGWKEDIDANREKWMEWSAQSSLYVLEFAENFAVGADSVYRSINMISGVLNLSAVSFTGFAQGIQSVFEKSNRFFADVSRKIEKLPGGDDAKIRELIAEMDQRADYWAQAQKDSATIVEKALAGADKSFERSSKGLALAQKAAENLHKVRKSLEQNEAKPIDSVTSSVKKATVELKEVDGVWTAVSTSIKEKSKTTTDSQVSDLDRFKDEFGRTMREIEADAGKTVDEIYDELQRLTSKKWVADVHVTKTSSGGGGAGGYYRGGPVRGPGGIDNVPAWLTHGEYVINRTAVSRIGVGYLNALNSLQLPELPRFASGGPVGAVAGGGGYGNNLTLQLYPDQPSVTIPNVPRQTMAEIQRQERKANRLRSQ